MIIQSYAKNADIHQLELRLYSTDLRFTYHMFPTSIFPPPEVDRTHRAVIEFNDSREIDMLIGMLERFKKENVNYMGYWV